MRGHAHEEKYGWLARLVSSLAYADDLPVMGGATAQPLKVWLPVHDQQQPFEPDIGNGQTIPALKWEDTYKYLGVLLGRERKGSLDTLANEMAEMAGKIASSGLTDWQKIDALNTFVLTKATYQFDTAVIDQTWATKVDAKLKKAVKKALRLPNRTTSPFFYTEKSSGGLGLTSLEDTLQSLYPLSEIFHLFVSFHFFLLLLAVTVIECNNN